MTANVNLNVFFRAIFNSKEGEENMKMKKESEMKKIYRNRGVGDINNVRKRCKDLKQ